MAVETVVVKTDVNINSSYSLRWNRWLLKPIGAWPPSSSSTRFERNVTLFLNIICYTLMLVTLIPSFLHVILEDENFYVKMKSVSFVIHWLISGTNYTVLIVRRKRIRDCLEQIEYDWRSLTRKKDQATMLENAKLGYYVTILCAIVYHTSIMFYCAISALRTQVIKIGNETKIVHLLPAAVYKRLIPIDESPRLYEVALTAQMIAIFLLNTIVIGTFSLVAAMAAHACGQLEVLMARITEFVNEFKTRNEADPFRKIKVVIEHHTKVLDFIANIEDAMNWTCFMELFRCTSATCVLGYYVLMEWADGDARTLITYFVILSAIIFNSFAICYVGDLLTEQCQKVGEAAYMANWYQLPDERIHDLMLIIARSNVVVKLTAGNIIHVSLYTFSDVVKTGFAYLNLLKQMS